jgi:hypothetical protein
MKTKSKTTGYIVHGIAAAVLALTAQISLAGSASWLLFPQNSAWENVNNWTPGGPPNGPSDIATFAQSSQTGVNISKPEEVNSIVFTSGSASYDFSVLGPGELIISGAGVTNNNSVLQTFEARSGGKIIFNNTATAASAHMSIVNSGQNPSHGSTIFNDASSAAGSSISNQGSSGVAVGGQAGKTIFNGTSTAGHAAITNDGGHNYLGSSGSTIFNDSSTADTATLVASGGGHYAAGGAIVFTDTATAGNAIIIANGIGHIRFNGASTGGTARVELFAYGSLDIRGHGSGVTIGSIEGSGNIFLGANNLTVGTNDIDTVFSGAIYNDGQRGSLAKIGSGVLTLQTSGPPLPNDCIADTVGLILVSGSIVKLDFTGAPDVIGSLKVNGVPQPPGIYGGPMSGAPNILPEFEGSGTVSVGPVSTLGNISTRGFVQTGENVVIGGFIVQGHQIKRVIIRAIGPELTRYGVPNALANPTLELHDATGALIASNNNWATTIIGGIITTNQAEDIRNSGYAPSNELESAIFADLEPGKYTAIVRGVNNSTGVALADVYDLSPETYSVLRNISTRGFVQAGDNVMIDGFIVAGTGPKRVLVRGIGPELTQYGITNPLANPGLELYDGTGTLIASNNDWQTTIIGGIITSSQVSAIQNSGYSPTAASESAIIANLQPGNYTAIVRGLNNTAGVALLDVYDLDPRVQ